MVEGNRSIDHAERLTAAMEGLVCSLGTARDVRFVSQEQVFAVSDIEKA